MVKRLCIARGLPAEGLQDALRVQDAEALLEVLALSRLAEVEAHWPEGRGKLAPRRDL